MVEAARPYRSVLYIPASNERALRKARDLAADAIIFDLEDAVAVSGKDAARERLVSVLAEGGYGEKTTIVRINGLDTAWGEADLEAALKAGPSAILLPKVGSAALVRDVASRIEAQGVSTNIWAMMETPQGILNAGEIVSVRRMAGLVMGTNDLAREINCRAGPDRGPMMMALQHCLLAARSAGIACIDGVYNAFKDDDGLRAECLQGRDLGMDGKTLIHPAQIGIANEVFAPNDDELELARRQIAAFEEATARGEGVAVLDGRIVENLHVATAEAILRKAEMIARMEAA